VVADILARVMDSDSKRAEFESQGVTGYDVAANRLQRGPVVEVIGKGPSADAAVASAEAVLADADGTLAEVQEAEHADPDYFITSAPLEPASTATAMFGSTLRTAIAVMALGGLGTLGLAVVAEAISRRRAVPPTPEANALAADGVDPDTERDASNGSNAPDWSVIASTLRLAQSQPAEHEAAHHEAAREDHSKKEPGWQRTTSKPSRRSSADNGHGRPTTHRSL
jgi:hypothetical protein